MSKNVLTFLARCLLGVTMAAAAFSQNPDLDARLARGQQLRVLGRFSDAELELRLLLRDVHRADPRSPLEAMVLDALATTEQDFGNYLDAEKYATDAIALLKRLGPPDLQAATAISHLGEMYLEEGRNREAEPMLRKAMEIQQQLPKPDPVAIAILLADLAMVFEHTQRLAQAESLLRQSLAQMEQSLGPNNPMLSAPLGPLAAVLSRMGRYSEALGYSQRCWDILSRSPGIAEPDKLNTMSALGRLYAVTGRPQEAEFYSRQAAERAEAIYGPQHPRLGYYLKNYAEVLRILDRKNEAKAIAKRADSILSTSAQSNPIQTIHASALR